MSILNVGSVNLSRCRLFFIASLLLAALLPPLFGDTLSIQIAERPCRLICPEPGTLRAFKKNSRFPSFPLFARSLDSLGFFSNSIDSCRDTALICTGPRTQVSALSLASPLIPLSALEKSLRSPFFYDAARINSLSRAALDKYADAGYPFASVDVSPQPDSTAGRMRISLSILPGRPAVFGPILLPDSTVTRPAVLLRDISLKAGSPFSASRVRRAEEALCFRPYVVSARALAPTVKPSVVDSLPDTAHVAFDIVDRSGMGLDGALGYSSEAKNGVIGSLQLSMLDLFHRGEVLALGYRGEKEFQSLSLSGGLPSPFGIPLDVSASFAMEVKEKSHGSVSGELMLLANLGRNLQGGVALSAEELSIVDLPVQHSAGADLILRRRGEKETAGTRSYAFALRTGSSFADHGTGLLPRLDLDMASRLLQPLAPAFSLCAALRAQMIRVGIGDSLHVSEKIPLGGNNSLRGYAQDQFAVCAAGYVQVEGRWYFGRTGHLFVFTDGGSAVLDEHDWTAKSALGLFGYGAGLRVPVRIGVLSIAYARNRSDGRSPGRIHAGIQNDIAAAVSTVLK